MKAIQNSEFRIQNIKKGFTLIELLIVIAIIGILASLLMVNFIGVRQRARDSQRKADLRQIQSALELYRADQGSYPTTLSSCGSQLTGGSPATTYMQKIPCDPLNTGQTSSYSATTNEYSLFSCLENINDSQKDAANNAACGTEKWSFTLTNP